MLEVDGLRIWFPLKRGLLQRKRAWVRAVDGVSFRVARGETLGLVGESGCGKTTTGRAIVLLETPLSGTIRVDGQTIFGGGRMNLRPLRRRFQMVFQDPHASLNPRMTVGEIVAEPLDIHGLYRGQARAARVAELLGIVGLEVGIGRRYPIQLSGGQLQRVGIARALAVEPRLLICDEPVSALDVSIQAQVVNLLEELQSSLGLTYLFIAHDLAVVRHIADRVAVMYLGRLVEIGPSDGVYGKPRHPYTQALLSAIPVPDAGLERTRRRIILSGEIPSAASPPSGCGFRTRCLYAQPVCAQEVPPLVEAAPGHLVACHFWAELGAGYQALTEQSARLPATEGAP